MKKLLFLSVSMVLVVGVNAQTRSIKSVPNEAIPAPVPQKMEKEHADYAAEDFSRYNHTTFTNVSAAAKKKQKGGNNYTPFGYVLSTEYAASIVGDEVVWGGGNPYTDICTLFPDSLTTSHVFITNAPANSFKRQLFPAIGYTFDPYSKAFDMQLLDRLFEDPVTKELCGYSIDTLAILGEYRIANYNPNSPDTLRVFLSYYNSYDYPNGNPDPRRRNEYFSLVFSTYGNNLLVPVIEYDNRNNIAQKGPVTKPAAANTVTIDYILSNKDSANLPMGYMGYRVMTIPVADYIGSSFEVPVGSVTSVIMKFIPGYNYNNGDTIRKISYNSQIGSYVADEIRKNIFSAAIINDDDYFESFLDWGDGYNGRIMENQNARYDMDTANKNAAWNPYHHSVYSAMHYPIPCVYMHISTDDDWWYPNPSPVPMYTIQGTITSNGTPLSGVKITCSNGGVAFTDASGKYSITVDSNETGTITPSLAKYNFFPPSIPYSAISTNLTYRDFFAMPFPTYTIEGYVDFEGDPLEGVTITCSNGNSAITNINGRYTITVDSSETVTLTPSLWGYDFTPTSITCPDVTGNLTEQDFIATLTPPPTYTLQGRVNYIGSPLAGVTIDCDNGSSEVTDANGNYTITVDSNESVVLTPSLAGYTFLPKNITIADIASNFIKLDFTATYVGIPDIKADNICIYPNPTSGKLTIENGELEIEKIEIYDVVGQLLYQINKSTNKQINNEISIDISHLAAGIYFLKIDNRMAKFVKE